VGIPPATIPETCVTEAISDDLSRQRVWGKERPIDRASWSSPLVRKRSDDREISCKAWPVSESASFTKQTCALDWERQSIRCPAEQERPCVPGGVVHFPKDTCAQCPLKEQCMTRASGRSVSIHPDEALPVRPRAC
jgi:transposase